MVREGSPVAKGVIGKFSQGAAAASVGKAFTQVYNIPGVSSPHR